MPNVHLPDGTVQWFEPGELTPEMERSGLFTPESDAAALVRAGQERDEQEYSGLDNQLLTFAENAGDALLLGVPGILGGADPAREARARVNSGSALLGTVAGAVAPAILSGGTSLAGTAAGTAARLTPMGALSAAGTALGAGRGLAARTAIAAGEGAVAGAMLEASRLRVAGDELTAEAIINAAGRDAMFAGGLTALAGGVSKVANRVISRGDEVAAEASRAAKLDEGLKSKNFQDAYSEVRSLRQQAIGAKQAGVAHLAPDVASRMSDEIKYLTSTVTEMRVAGANVAEAADLLKSVRGGQKQLNGIAKKATMSAGDVAFLQKQAGAISKLHDAVGTAPFALNLDDLKQLSVNDDLARVLNKMPESIDGFAKMRPESVRQIATALDSLPQGKAALKKLADSSVDFGLTPSGTAVDDVLSLHGALQTARAATAKGRAGSGIAGDLARGYIGNKVGGALSGVLGITTGGFGQMAGMALALRGTLTRAITDVVTGGVSKAAKAGPVAVRGYKAAKAVKAATAAVQKLAPQLVTSPRGALERRQAVKDDIAKRFHDSQMAADAFYEAVRPISATSPEAGAMVQNKALGGIQHVVEKAPKDPGLSRHLLRSDWMPSEQQVRDHQTRLRTVYDPVGALGDIMNGEINPVAVETLWRVNPAMMREAASVMMSEVQNLKGAPLGTVTAWSVAFKVPLDGLLLPENVAMYQSLFQLPANEKKGMGGAQPEPPEPALTQVQKLQGR